MTKNMGYERDTTAKNHALPGSHFVSNTAKGHYDWPDKWEELNEEIPWYTHN